MSSGFIAIVLLSGAGAFIVILAVQKGRWRERARAAEKQNETDRKANEIKNRVVSDPAYRVRVRKFFGGS